MPLTLLVAMQQFPEELTASFQRRLDQAHVSEAQRQDYYKWACFYIRFDFPATAPTALGPFLTKLAAKGYSIEQRHHAATAVRLLVRPDPKDPSLYHHLSNSSPFGSPPGAFSQLASAPSANPCASAAGQPTA